MQQIAHAVKSLLENTQMLPFSPVDDFGNVVDLGVVTEVEINSELFICLAKERVQLMLDDIIDEKRTKIYLDESKQRYKSLFEFNSDAIYSLDLTGSIMSANSSMGLVTGYSLEELIGQSIFLFIAPNDVLVAKEAFESAKMMTSYPEHELLIKHKDGHYIECRVKNAPIIVNGITEGIFGIAKDLSESKLKEVELQETKELLKNVFDSLDACIWSYDVAAKKIVHCSQSIEQICGFTVQEAIDRPEVWEKIMHMGITWGGKKPKGHKGNAMIKECRIKHKNGEMKWVHSRVTTIFDDQGRLTRLNGVTVDINDRKKAEETIHKMAFYDPLTGLPNRINLEKLAADQMREAVKSGKSLSLLFLDIDNFKQINDSMGHNTGDQVLQIAAKRLKKCIRNGDTAARLGGDEFVILLTDNRDHDEVEKIARRIIGTFKKPLCIDDHHIYATTSIGISSFPSDGESVEELIKNADMAMYKAKALGRSNYQFYDRKMKEQSMERRLMEKQLHYALDKKEFEIYYQPQIDTKIGSIVGAEALLRWKHPKLGLVPPADFIPLAEAFGLIVPISNWILETVCKQNKKWQDAGLPPLCISVNLSAQHFKQNDLIENVRRILSETRLEPKFLKLEITESIAMNNETEVIETLLTLKSYGIEISIDDFGSGYSSLSYLKNFPVKSLKIDKSFIKDIPQDKKDEAIVKAIIGLAKNLNFDVIAEGVETNEQLEFLQFNDCYRIQGFYTGRPVNVKEFEKVLTRAALFDEIRL